MKRRRRLRKLVPDAELIRRRSAGEPLRPLASDYGVAHTTLLDYFERPEVAREIKQAEKQLRAEQRAVADRRARPRGGWNRRCAGRPGSRPTREREDPRRVRGVVAERTARRRRPRSDYKAWLDERDAWRPLTRADLHSQSDEIAARVVAEGGGMQDVIDATGLRTLENVVGSVDPAILKGAYDNDLLRQAQPPPT